MKPRYYKGDSSFNMSEVKNALDDIRKVNVLKRQKITLEVNIVGVKDLCIEIEKLEDLEEQDVLTWSNDFANAMKTCGYEEETSFKILQAIVSPEIREKISRRRTTVTALEKLKELVYTETKGKELLNELKTIKMTKKENMKDFYKRF